MLQKEIKSVSSFFIIIPFSLRKDSTTEAQEKNLFCEIYQQVLLHIGRNKRRDIAAEFGSCDFTAESLKAATERVGEKHQVKLGKLQAPLRVAITGRTVGPPLFEPIELLGREESLRRIQSAITRAS